MVELSIVLPAYEEAANLKTLLPNLLKVVERLGVTAEIVVVDAPERRDATPEICAEFGARWLSRTGGMYYGDAIRTGVAAATGRYVVFMDADGSHSPEFIDKLWEARQSGDLVIASRYVNGGATENPFILVLMSWAVNLVFRIVLSLRCSDVSNSFRLYRGEQLRSLTLECTNFDVVEEILVRLTCANPKFKIVEIPFRFEKRREGKTKRDLVAFVLTYLDTLVRLYRVKRVAARDGKRAEQYRVSGRKSI